MSYQNDLKNQLLSLLGILELDRASPLYQDVNNICNYLDDSAYRIAVFAPFNHGKSTLLNALLGNKTLPIDLIPTTGAAIEVGYGEELVTKITLKDGTQIMDKGVKILKQYAILDGDRRMKEEVQEVRVFCNHAWLKTGVKFLDLPGTNDREAQNELVKAKLLSADLVIHVLDARKLMTLEEREHLRYWLENRGITTVIFVVNFLNLLTIEERQEVQNRLCFVAESFRSSLPPGVSNLYYVDALPALRARIKGNHGEAQTTGITTLESALQNIVNLHQQEPNKLSRVIKIAEKLLIQANKKQEEIQVEITNQRSQIEKKVNIRRKAEKLIQQSLDRSISDLSSWLYLPKLLSKYQPSLAIALQQTRFEQWLESEFKPEAYNYQQTINKWIDQGCDFFQHSQPQLLEVDFSHAPVIEIPQYTSEVNNNTSKNKYYIPQKLNFLLQKKAGAVALGGANYILNKIANKTTSNNEKNSINPLPKISSQIYIDAAESYLKEFSDRNNNLLRQYESTARKYITYIPTESNRENINAEYQLQLITNLVDNLKQTILLMNN